MTPQSAPETGSVPLWERMTDQRKKELVNLLADPSRRASGTWTRELTQMSEQPNPDGSGGLGIAGPDMATVMASTTPEARAQPKKSLTRVQALLTYGYPDLCNPGAVRKPDEKLKRQKNLHEARAVVHQLLQEARPALMLYVLRGLKASIDPSVQRTATTIIQQLPDAIRSPLMSEPPNWSDVTRTLTSDMYKGARQALTSAFRSEPFDVSERSTADVVYYPLDMALDDWEGVGASSAGKQTPLIELVQKVAQLIEEGASHHDTTVDPLPRASDARTVVVPTPEDPAEARRALAAYASEPPAPAAAGVLSPDGSAAKGAPNTVENAGVEMKQRIEQTIKAANLLLEKWTDLIMAFRRVDPNRSFEADVSPLRKALIGLLRGKNKPSDQVGLQELVSTLDSVLPPIEAKLTSALADLAKSDSHEARSLSQRGKTQAELSRAKLTADELSKLDEIQFMNLAFTAIKPDCSEALATAIVDKLNTLHEGVDIALEHIAQKSQYLSVGQKCVDFISARWLVSIATGDNTVCSYALDRLINLLPQSDAQVREIALKSRNAQIIKQALPHISDQHTLTSLYQAHRYHEDLRATIEQRIISFYTTPETLRSHPDILAHLAEAKDKPELLGLMHKAIDLFTDRRLYDCHPSLSFGTQWDGRSLRNAEATLTLDTDRRQRSVHNVLQMGAERIVFDGTTTDTIIKVCKSRSNTSTELDYYLADPDIQRYTVPMYGVRTMMINGQEYNLLLQQKLQLFTPGTGGQRVDIDTLRLAAAETDPRVVAEYLQETGIPTVEIVKKLIDVWEWGGKMQIHDTGLKNMGITPDNNVVFLDLGAARKENPSQEIVNLLATLWRLSELDLPFTHDSLPPAPPSPDASK